MKKRVLLTLAISIISMVLLAVSVSAVDLITSTSDEFGTVTVVDGMTSTVTDTTARVVLKNADGTYSTYYTYYIYPSLSYNKGLESPNYTALNTATNQSYSNDSVVRIEFVKDAKAFLIPSAYAAKEIVLPADSGITKISRNYNNTALEKINIPVTVTKIDQNAFRDFTGLKEVTFDEGIKLTTITAEAFKGCTSLEGISLPDSITTVGTNAFWGCTSLTTIRYGANLQTFASRATSHTTVFYMSNTTMKDYTGTMNHDYFGESYTPKAATIFYTGTYDEAVAFRSKSTHKDAWNGTGGLSNAVLVEWNSENPDSYYISDTQWTIVYGYNKCKAFYDNVHLPEETTYEFEGEKYLSVCNAYTGCPRCLNGTPTKVCDALYTNKGYSKETGGTSFTYGITLNTSEIAKYENATGVSLGYGFVIGSYQEGDTGEIVDKTGIALDGTLITDFSSVTFNNFTIYNLKVTGISSEEQQALMFYCSAYIIDGDKVSYIGETVTDTATPVSFATLPTKED